MTTSELDLVRSSTELFFCSGHEIVLVVLCAASFFSETVGSVISEQAVEWRMKF